MIINGLYIDKIDEICYYNMTVTITWHVHRKREIMDQNKYQLLLGLVRQGVIYELCPTVDYWHYQVLQPEKLPASLLAEFKRLGELRV
ncbi:MAG: hypothetical protein QG603_79 [Patescibacteria group bacterium]|nr:hypothetical protein [Patescibacteria group bacterium]